MVALAGAALMATSGVAMADTETGQVGDYNFRDTQAKPVVSCIYSGSNPYKLTSIVVKPPAVWWPDSSSTNNREHGKVGLSLAVQTSLPGAYGPWKTFYTSDTDKARAYEDRPAYDAADGARLATYTLSFNPKPFASHHNAYARVEATVYWYRADGSVMGSVVHDYDNFKWVNTTSVMQSTTACPIRFTPL
jgi:hypothetical protein